MINLMIINKIKMNKEEMPVSKNNYRYDTIVWGEEVNVTVTGGPASGGVFTDTNGSKALEFRECVKELTVRYVRVQITYIKRGWCRGRRWNHRHYPLSQPQ